MKLNVLNDEELPETGFSKNLVFEKKLQIP